MGYAHILGTVLLTVYGQMIVKWQVSLAGPMPAQSGARVGFLWGLLVNPWILSSLTAAFVAFLCWVGALSKFELSHAYPFMSLSFVLVLALSAVFFREAATLPKILGMTLIVAGIALGSRG